MSEDNLVKLKYFNEICVIFYLYIMYYYFGSYIKLLNIKFCRNYILYIKSLQICVYIYIYSEKFNIAEKIMVIDAFNAISLFHRRYKRIKGCKMWLDVFRSLLFRI